jgi:flagellar hook-length control protein FliK
VLQALTPLRHAPDGSYSLELQLHPRELGPVQVTVELRHGQLSIHLHAADAGAGDLLRAQLPDLREQLEAQGLLTAELDVGSGGPRGRPTPEPRDLTPAPVRPARADDPAGAPAPAPTAAGAPSNGLDIRL